MSDAEYTEDFVDEADIAAILEEYHRKQLLENLMGPAVSLVLHIIVLTLMFIYVVTNSIVGIVGLFLFVLRWWLRFGNSLRFGSSECVKPFLPRIGFLRSLRRLVDQYQPLDNVPDGGRRPFRLT